MARCRVEAERLYVAYEPLFETSGFVAPEVIVEFGARSTGEPHANRPVVCDAAAYLPGLTFSRSTPHRHVGGADLLGKGNRDSRLLPPGAPARRASVEALA